ncbi:hypothetical protein CC80DRAFT_538174 [Byssothecium circinans]|uniref:Mid2 domain-containing protein n=1 Tax=Byssothecium circinans TaxID=147558 RepID=A0A6A5TUA1_9PLEO|nr:hypothetical protein CC80DRAFT_538174 [Byssothecium circinans]
MLSHALCAFIAPALASAVAFPWALPEPTFVIPEVDRWSPAPTKAPNVGILELFRRAEESDTICGFVSGVSTSSLTCDPGKSSVCATNTYYGVHGCCDPKNMSACTIPTTCIPSSLMTASCSDAKCSSDPLTLKCSGTAAPECYRWDFAYSTAKTTTFKEWGCAAKGGTAVAERTWSGMSTPSKTSSTTTRTTSSTSASSTAAQATTLPATQSPGKPNNTAAIVGGTIGGLVVVGAVASFIIYLLLRDRRLKREASNNNLPTHQSQQTGFGNTGMTEYSPHGFTPVNAWQDDNKGWPGSPTTTVLNKSPVISDCGPGGDGQATMFGVVEAHGTQVHEAPV